MKYPDANIERFLLDESYHSNDSFVTAAQGRLRQRQKGSSQRQDRLVEIEELSESSLDVSSSFSDDNEEDGQSSKPRNGFRHTDQELLDRTLKKYVNPRLLQLSTVTSSLPANNGQNSSGWALEDADVQVQSHAQPSANSTDEEHPNGVVLEDDFKGKNHAQPSAEEVDDDAALLETK